MYQLRDLRLAPSMVANRRRWARDRLIGVAGPRRETHVSLAGIREALATAMRLDAGRVSLRVRISPAELSRWAAQDV